MNPELDDKQLGSDSNNRGTHGRQYTPSLNRNMALYTLTASLWNTYTIRSVIITDWPCGIILI